MVGNTVSYVITNLCCHDTRINLVKIEFSQSRVVDVLAETSDIDRSVSVKVEIASQLVVQSVPDHDSILIF